MNLHAAFGRHERLVASALLILFPMLPGVLWSLRPGTTGAALGVAVILCLPFAALVLAPIARPRLGSAAALALGAVVSALMAIGGPLVLWLALSRYCTERTGLVALASVIAVAVYLPTSAWVFRRQSRPIWGWPLIVAIALTVWVVVLAIATGGAHHCET